MSVHAKEWPLCAVSVPARIVCHAVCPNSRLNARFEGIGCLHMPSRLEGRKLHVLSGLVGSNITASDSGFPIHTQEVTGSSPVAPTTNLSAFSEWFGPAGLQYPLEILLSEQQALSKQATNEPRGAPILHQPSIRGQDCPFFRCQRASR